MKPKVSIKQIILSCTTALVCGVIFAVIIPILALFVLDVFITVASVFDPLHQGKNIEAVWSPFIAIVIIQIIFPVLASIATGIVITFLTENMKTAWVYGVGLVLSLGIYGVFQFISTMFVGLFASELVVISWALVSLSIVAVSSTVIGLICVAVNRTISMKNYVDSQLTQTPIGHR